MRKPALRSWMSRNDPAGFLSASLLTVAAMIDQQLTSGATPPHGEGSELLTTLVRLPGGNPTALAVLAREYAKTHAIPAPAPRKQAAAIADCGLWIGINRPRRHGVHAEDTD